MELNELVADVEDVSTFYASHNGITRSDDWLLLKLQEEVGELTQAYLARSGQARDKGMTQTEITSALEDELADVIAHALLIAHRFDIDLSAALSRKWLVYRPQN